MWKQPWGYAEGWVICAGLLITGFGLQLITGPVDLFLCVLKEQLAKPIKLFRRGCLYHRERLKERFFHHPILRDHDELCPIRHDR